MTIKTKYSPSTSYNMSYEGFSEAIMNTVSQLPQEQKDWLSITPEMAEAFKLIEETNECLYITGKAGTGKTTFLKFIVRHTTKQLAVAASTGIAAINAGGVTLHSLFGIPFGVQDPNAPMRGSMKQQKIELFKSLDTLIIDEISMVRPDILDYIDKKLRLYRMIDKPFGGVQVVMFGDLYQLPPVVKTDEKNILLQMYRGVYFFYAHVWLTEGFHVIELTHVFRQHDERFVEILNNIRSYQLYNRDIEDLDKVRDRRESQNFENEHVHICALRRDVEKINKQMLGEATHVYKATVEGDFNKGYMPCDAELSLRIGARVMMLTNDKAKLYYNGSLGVVTGLADNLVTVRLDSGCTVSVEPFEWTSHEYKLEDGKVVEKETGKCKQFPVSLAWAITIHKSQGLTFDKIVVHTKYAFSPGMLYVALSRCTSLEGIISETFIDKRLIIPDNQLIAFDKACAAHNGKFNRETYRNMNLK